MEIELGVGELLTVAGAGTAAFVVAQFAKKLFNLGAGWTRSIALVTGLAVVVSVTISTSSSLDFVGVLLAVLVGMQAGMSATAMFDTARSGIDYQVSPAPPAPGEHIAPIT